MRSRRAGISLTEVLIAMFIMAVGMIALMTLFPLGAMRIGQSLKDDRCTQLALQMDGEMRAVWRNEVVAKLARGEEPTEAFYHAMEGANLYPIEPITSAQPARKRSLTTTGVDSLKYPVAALQLPAGNNAPATTGQVSATMLISAPVNATPPETGYSVSVTRVPATSAVGPSYPVLVDPYGGAALTNINSLNYHWLGGDTTLPRLQVPRRSLSGTPRSTPATALAFSKLTDDYTFEMNGSAGTGATVARQGRYSAAIMLRHKDMADRQRAEMKVLVFDGRSPVPIADDEALAEIDTNLATRTPVVSTLRQVQVRIKTRAEDAAPTIRRGGWLIDGTIDTRNGLNVRRANFHRIVSATVFASNTAQTTWDLDLETDLLPLPAATPAVEYQFYFMAGLSEVFDRADLVPDLID